MHLRLPKIRRTVQYIYLTALALLGLCMLIFPRQLWKNKQFPLDSKRRSEQSIHILNENKRCRLSCFSSYSFHLLQTAVTPTGSCAPSPVSPQACRTPADLRLTDRSMNGEAYAVDSAGLPARVIRRFVLFLWNQT